MSDRQLVLEAVQKMPEAASLADILDELEMLASIREGLAQSERGEGVPHARVLAMVDELDSRMNTLFHFLKTEVESVSEAETWSHYHPGFERHFYLDFFRRRLAAHKG